MDVSFDQPCNDFLRMQIQRKALKTLKVIDSPLNVIGSKTLFLCPTPTVATEEIKVVIKTGKGGAAYFRNMVGIAVYDGRPVSSFNFRQVLNWPTRYSHSSGSYASAFNIAMKTNFKGVSSHVNRLPDGLSRWVSSFDGLTGKAVSIDAMRSAKNTVSMQILSDDLVVLTWKYKRNQFISSMNFKLGLKIPLNNIEIKQLVSFVPGIVTGDNSDTQIIRA